MESLHVDHEEDKPVPMSAESEDGQMIDKSGTFLP